MIHFEGKTDEEIKAAFEELPDHLRQMAENWTKAGLTLRHALFIAKSYPLNEEMMPDAPDTKI